MPSSGTAPASSRRPYGELDADLVTEALIALARRVGVGQVTMRGLAAELGAAVPSVYYHVPGKQAAFDLLADTVLATVPEPSPGSWQERLIELYLASRSVMLSVPGIAGLLQTNGDGKRARRLDGIGRSLVAQAGLAGVRADAAHTVLYTYLLGAVSLEEARPESTRQSARRATNAFRSGLEMIIAGIAASATR